MVSWDHDIEAMEVQIEFSQAEMGGGKKPWGWPRRVIRHGGDESRGLRNCLDGRGQERGRGYKSPEKGKGEERMGNTEREVW